MSVVFPVLLVFFPIVVVYCTSNNTTRHQFGDKYQGCGDCPNIDTPLYTINNVIGYRNSTGVYIDKILHVPRKREWKLTCWANYPIEWIFHFDEDDDPDIADVSVVSKRFFKNFDDPQTYLYQIFVMYDDYVHHAPNYTCQSVGEPKKRTRIMTSLVGDPTDLKLLSGENDYVPKSRRPTDLYNCTTLLFLSLRDESGPLAEPGPCHFCNHKDSLNIFAGKRSLTMNKECNHLFLCRSLFMHVQNLPACIGYYKPSNTSSTQVFHPLPGLALPEDTHCTTEPSLKPFVASCRPITDRKADVAQMGFYGVVRVMNYKRREPRPHPYFRWADVDTRDMIQIQISPPPHGLPNYYEGDNVKVTCIVSTFYCSFFVAFSYQWEDWDSREYVATNAVIQDRVVELSKGYNGYYNQSFNFNLEAPINISFGCHGPVVNSSEWINATAEIYVRPAIEPSILYLNWTSGFPLNPEHKEEYHTEGEVEERLNCVYVGDPIKSVWWRYNGEETLPPGVTVETDEAKSTTSLLFPTLLKQHEGNYTCMVETYKGKQNSAEFELKVDEEEKMVGNAEVPNSFIAIFVFMATCFAIAMYRMWKVVVAQREVLRSLTDGEVDEFRNGVNSMEMVTMGNSNSAVEALPYDPKYEVDLDDLHIDFQNMLGFGEFGFVYKGQLDKGPAGDCVPVAVKTVKENVEVNHFKALLSEIKILMYVGEHENVVNLIGASTQNIKDRKIYILVELCVGGSLENYLKSNRENFVSLVQYGQLRPEKLVNMSTQESQEYFIEGILHTGKLFKWVQETASGLSYIHSRKVIHADLAVRNVLLTNTLVAKISDFGLSRQLLESTQYVKKTQCPLPWRYMPPESLEDKVFSTKSDVWGLGVTIWEIFELGKTPYPGQNYGHGFLSELKHGLRLTKPQNATNDVYEFMLQCWEHDAADRPEAEDVMSICQKALRDIEGHST